jgi:hypothetical protein
VIYAIRAVGTEFVKIGVASSVSRRLKELDTGCPHDLHIEAVADWPDSQESAIHRYLSAHCEKLEWFRDSERTSKVISWLQDRSAGLTRFQYEFTKYIGRSDWRSVPKRLVKARETRELTEQKQPRVGKYAPSIAALRLTQEVHERYEHIKQRALAKQAAKRSQETASEPAG